MRIDFINRFPIELDFEASRASYLCHFSTKSQYCFRDLVLGSDRLSLIGAMLLLGFSILSLARGL